jgi:NADH:ubiquinone oxidoreductase subunit F (NADH-binding)
MPTTVNNVETFSHVPHIIAKGADWFRGFGTEKSPGTTIFGVSGHVQRPGSTSCRSARASTRSSSNTPAARPTAAR